jgi:hypothetical protein
MMHSIVELADVEGAVSVATLGPNKFPENVSLESLAAAVGTAPTGADLTFDVILQPAATTIATGTIAATEQIATFTAFDPGVAVPVATSWLEVDVTQVGSTVAGSDLKVKGKVGFAH